MKRWKNKTRGGHDVVIYTQDGKGFRPIVGDVHTSSGVWYTFAWTTDGRFGACDTEHDFDLIEDVPQFHDRTRDGTKVRDLRWRDDSNSLYPLAGLLRGDDDARWGHRGEWLLGAGEHHYDLIPLSEPHPLDHKVVKGSELRDGDVVTWPSASGTWSIQSELRMVEHRGHGNFHVNFNDDYTIISRKQE